MRCLFLVMLACLLHDPTPALAQWTHVGGPPGALVRSVVGHEGRHLIATSRGVYISDDDGASWSRSNNGLQPSSPGSPPSVLSLQVVGDAILAGGTGLHRSTDGGQSWTTIADVPSGASIVTMAARGMVALAGSQTTYGNPGTIFRSMDGGVTWQDVGSSIPLDASIPRNFLAVGITSTGFLVGTYGGLFRSIDDGTSWELVGPDPARYVTALECIKDTVFAAGGYDLFRSLDNGVTWEKILVDTRGDINDIAVSRTSVVVCTRYGGLYQSNDGGVTWSRTISGILPSGPHEQGDMLACWFDDQLVLIGERHIGVIRSRDRGRSWDQADTDLGDANVNDLAVKDDAVLAGMNYGLLRSTDQGATWMSLPSRPTYDWINVVSVLGDRIVCNAQNGISYSDDDGVTWSSVEVWPRSAARSVIQHRDRIYVATDSGVIKGTLAMGSWERLTGGLPAKPALSLAASGNIILVGMINEGLFRSTDAGLTFTRMDVGFTGTMVQRIAIEGSIVLAGTNDGVMRSTDLGASWARVANGPLGLTTISIQDGISLAGTSQFGAYLSTDVGATWRLINEGLELRYIRTVLQHGSMLYLGSKDGGVWKRPLQTVGVMETTLDAAMIKVTPNPSDGTVAISMHPDMTIDDVIVTSVLGTMHRLPTLAPVAQGSWLADLGGLAPGVYGLRVRVGERYETTFIVRR